MRIAVGVVILAAISGALQAQSNPRVRVQTELGDIVLELDGTRAPITTANFLKYVEAGHYDGGTFHRTVRMDNQPESPVKIEVIQAGVAADKAKQGFPPVALEPTKTTGILHKDGVVSMARGAPDSARFRPRVRARRQPQDGRPSQASAQLIPVSACVAYFKTYCPNYLITA